jgi:hypothetical protein
MPYLTLKAEAERPEGPWRKRYDITPYGPAPGTYYADTANPGHILKRDGECLSFFSAAIHGAGGVERTIGIARTRDLNGAWTPDPEPILPLGEQIENASVYYEPANGTWFLFTNHVALDEQGYEWTDAAWVYWTQDLDRWDPANKAVVVDGKTSTWAHACIGMPAAIPYGDRLAVLYDGAPGESRDHMGRRVGLAWLDLPLEPPG